MLSLQAPPIVESVVSMVLTDHAIRGRLYPASFKEVIEDKK